MLNLINNNIFLIFFIKCYKSAIIFLVMNEETKNRIRKMTVLREWSKFHTPANLAKSISIEANELLECFQWDEENYNIEEVKKELADVMIYCFDLLEKLDLDEDDIINSKMDENEKKYPVKLAKGNSKKYNKL